MTVLALLVPVEETAYKDILNKRVLPVLWKQFGECGLECDGEVPTEFGLYSGCILKSKFISCTVVYNGYEKVYTPLSENFPPSL